VSARGKVLTGRGALTRLARALGGEKTVLCHGHFNVIHPGHGRFLGHARTLGTKLVVGLISDRAVREMNPDGNFFPQMERAETLAARDDVDRVVVLDGISIEELIEAVRPACFVLGKEFEEEMRDRAESSIRRVKALGGDVVFHSGPVSYSTADLLDRPATQIEGERARAFQEACGRQGIDLEETAEDLGAFSSLRLLVLGDAIVDRYIACDALGMSAEAPVIALKEVRSRDYIGGAAIVAAHVRTLGARCDLISVTGADEPAGFLRESLLEKDVVPHLYADPGRPTTFKVRYMVGNQKLLRVSRLEETSIPRKVEREVIARIGDLVPQVDGVIVSDFVYGLVTPRVLEATAAAARRARVPIFGDLQCSTQVGSVLKFRNFDLICPNEREARIALGDNDSGLEKVAMKLLSRTGCAGLLLTLGANGAVAYDHRGPAVASESFPALEPNPVDVTGAGDSLLASASVALAAGWSLMKAAALGTCVAALAVGRAGNVPIAAPEVEAAIRRLAGAPARPSGQLVEVP
jgi:rfaE bifunctional protein kinase chain/domain